MIKYCHVYVALGILFIHACAPAAEPPAESLQDTDRPAAAIPLVQTTVARRAVLPLRLRANGIIRAREQAIIRAELGGKLVLVPREGQYYRTGTPLLRIDDTDLRHQLTAARLLADEARYRKNELLVQYNGEFGVDSSVNKQQLVAVLAQSGYPSAHQAVETAEFQLGRTRTLAPFGGTAVNVKVENHQIISAGEEVCTLVNLNSLEVEFKVLEQEAVRIRSGQTVRVRPLSRPDLSLVAKVDIINPQVSEDGLVRIRARLQTGQKMNLFSGMNAEISLEQPTENKIVVPRSAVVLRSDRPVVFVYDPQERLAKWHYVEIAHENDEEIALLSGLEAGDRVIYTGNLTLDHNSEVRIDSTQQN